MYNFFSRFSIALFVVALAHMNLVQVVCAATSTTVVPCGAGQSMNYGRCSDVSIQYNYDAASGVSSYTPSNQSAFGINRSTDLASIESGICQTLQESGCDASSGAIDLCWQVFWLYSGLTGTRGVDVWNNLTGQSSDCGSWTSTSSSSSVSATTVLVSTRTFTTTLTSILSSGQTIRASSSQSPVSPTSVSSTDRSTDTSKSDTTVTQTVTSFTSSSTRASTTTTSDPFSMNGTPFIYNDASRLGFNVGLWFLSIVVSITFSSLIRIFG